MQYLKPRQNTISYFFHKISEFNYVAGNRLDNKEDVTERLIPLYHNLLREEMQEILDAKNAVDELDGLCDTAVVAYFLVKLYDVEVNGFVPNPVMTDNVLEQIENIINSEDNEEKAIRALLMSLDTLAALDVDMFGALHEVAESNLSKFIKFENIDEAFELHESDLMYISDMMERIEAQGRYTGVHYEEVRVDDTLYVVLKDNAGKVLKADGFKEPKLKQYINKKSKGAK